jgi:hypothetical protein
VAIVVKGANVHDSLLLQDALEAVIVEPPNPYTELKQHLCLDKAFDGKPSEATAQVFGYEPHIRRIGEEKLGPQDRPQEPQGPAVGGGTDDRLAQPLPRNLDPLREESRELPCRGATRMRPAVVQTAAQAHDLRWILSQPS